MDKQAKLYSDLASWWPLMSPPEEYLEEATNYHETFTKFSPQPIKTMLELGSGGGNNASYFKKWYSMTLADLSEGMQDVSRKLNPECEHVQGDMRSLQLNKTFDAVFVHVAVMYMTTEDDLKAAIKTAFEHCKPGGIALFVPDWVKDQYMSETEHGGEDGKERSMRWLSWAYDPDPTDDTFITNYAYMLKDKDGSVTVESEQQLEGLFTKDKWLQLLSQAGFSAQAVPFEYSDMDNESRTGFVALRP